ncbi:MAG: VOC family protein [Parvularculales bacterium]
MTDRGFTHIALTVRDAGASRSFYEHYGALSLVDERVDSTTDRRVVWLDDGRRPFLLVLIEAEKVVPLQPISHLGFACPSRAEVDRLCDDAKGDDVLVSGPEDYGPPVGYWALIRDPDGHTIEISYGQDTEIASHNSTHRHSGAA